MSNINEWMREYEAMGKPMAEWIDAPPTAMKKCGHECDVLCKIPDGYCECAKWKTLTPAGKETRMKAAINELTDLVHISGRKRRKR